MKGCLHIRIENGRIGNIFSHLTEIPIDTGIIHLSGDGIAFESDEQFLKSHPKDKNEIVLLSNKAIFELGDDRVTIFGE